MKRLENLLFLTLILTLPIFTAAQRPKAAPKARPTGTSLKPKEIGATAVVMDETLSVLREKPGLFAMPVHRMQRGRKVQILGVAEADGVKFYKVSAPPSNFGWVQADA